MHLAIPLNCVQQLACNSGCFSLRQYTEVHQLAHRETSCLLWDLKTKYSRLHSQHPGCYEQHPYLVRANYKPKLN